MKRLLIIPFLLISISHVLGQTDTLYINRKVALDMALETNPTMAIARLEKAKAEARLNQNRGNLLPSLNANAAYTRNLKKQVIFFPEEMAPLFGGVTALEVGNDNSYMGGFQFALPLYNPAIYRSIDAARAEQKIAEENFRTQAINLTYDVQSAWYNLLFTKEALEVNQLSFENARNNFENIRKFYQQGMVAEYDLIRAEVQTENSRTDVLQAQNHYELSINFLKTLLGINSETPIVIEGNLMDSSEEMLSTFNIISAEKSLLNNPDYVSLGLQHDLILRQSKSLRATTLPSVTAVSNYMFLTEANDFKFGNYNWVNTASAGLQVNIPIFRGFTNRNQVKQLEIGAKQIQLQRDYIHDNLDTQLNSILKNITLALEKTAHADKFVELAQRGYSIARLRYDSGQGTLLEVNDSDFALKRARFNLLGAKNELLQAKLQYDRLLGER
jgi:outer membrane protein